MGLQFRRGTAADVTSETFIPAIGEPLYVTDEEKLYVGDGSTVGGNIVGGAEDLKDLTDVHLTTEDIRSIQSYSASSNTVIINTTAGNPYKVNQQVTISNATVTALNGTHTIVSTPSANQFLFVLTTADVSNTVTTGTITPVIADDELITFDSVNSRFTNKKQSDILGRLSAHSDVDAYDTTGSNNDTGKVARLDYDDNWSIKRPGEAVNLTSGQHFIGVDFSAGTTGNIYTGNTANWTEGSGNSNTGLHSANPGSIPAPPYGDAAYDSTSHDYGPVAAYEDSTDFTLDFWLYRVGSAGAWEEGMLFYSNLSPSYKFFYPEYSGTALELKSGATTSGTVTTIAQSVIEWTVPSLNDQWVHVSIVRKGTDFRAWVNGSDQGAGTLQGSFTADHAFMFSSAGEFYSIQYEGDGHLVGPHYADLKKAHRDPAGGDIVVPVERVDFYNHKSGVNVSELADVTHNAFVDGDVLAYKSGIWTKGNISVAPDGTGELTVKGNATGGSGKIKLNCEDNSHGVTIKGPPHSAAATYTLTLPNNDGDADQFLQTDGSGVLSFAAPEQKYTKFQFNLGTAPTGAVSTSQVVGQEASIGSWSEVTFANTATNSTGPSTGFDPTLSGITHSSGDFVGFAAGVYKVDVSLELIIAGLANNSYNRYDHEIRPLNNTTQLPNTTQDFNFTCNATAPTGNTTQRITMSLVVHLENATAANNKIQFRLNSDQSNNYYCNSALATFTKIG